MNYRQQIDHLLHEAAALPDSPTRVALTEEAVSLADLHGDLEYGFEARQKLMESAMDAGRPDLLLVAFSWCLAQSDADPELFPPEQLIWSYRWVINEAASFPHISLPQIDDLLTDMERRYRQAGSSLRGYHLLRKNLFNLLGNHAKMVEAHKSWRATDRDWLSDNPETERAFHVSYLVELKKYEKAIDHAGPFLRGELFSEHFQATEMGELMVPLLRLGRLEEATRYHRRGLPLAEVNPRYIYLVGDHIAFLSISENLNRGAVVFRQHFPVALKSVDLTSRLHFYLDATLLTDRLVKRGDAIIELPKLLELPLERGAIGYQVQGLHEWLSAEVIRIASLFDERNGNQMHQTRIVEHQELQGLSLPVILPNESAKREPKWKRRNKYE